MHNGLILRINMNKTKKIIVGISIGDFNGVGVEIILKTFADKRMFEFCTPIIFGSIKVTSYYKKVLKLNTLLSRISSLNNIKHNSVSVLNFSNEDFIVELGCPSETSGKHATKSLESAVYYLKNKQIDVLLTAPVNKATIQSSSFNFPGQTEYLEQELKGKSLMILIAEELKIGLITGHIPISKVSETITPRLITEKVEIMYNSLVQDFRIDKPKIAILSLNPHCGDRGIIGKEDDEIIRPAIEKIKETGKLVFGPYAADGFFGSKNYKQFDGILAAYHDQGLVPFKALSFGKGVNFTAGLDQIRTSPDHGVGFDIAGKNLASPSSFKEALFTAIKIFKNRKEYYELKKNNLK